MITIPWIFLGAWVALAIACLRRGRAAWVALSIVAPIPVFVVAALVARGLLGSQQTGGLDDLGRTLTVLAAVILLTALSSLTVLVIGATRPRNAPVRDVAKTRGGGSDD